MSAKRDQRTSLAVDLAATTTKTFLREIGGALRGRVVTFSYVSATTKSTARLTATIRTLDGATVVSIFDVADGGGGSFRVFGALELSVSSDAVGTGGRLDFAILDDEAAVEALPPTDTGILVLPAVGLGGVLTSLGWCPFGRPDLCVYVNNDVVEVFFRDPAGNLVVCPRNEMVIHPPRAELVARNPTALLGASFNVCAVWDGR